MANFKVKYASELHIDRDWAFAPGHWFKLDWGKLQTAFPDPACFLVALDERQLNLLHQLLSVFPKYYRNWGYSRDNLDTAVWDDVQTWLAELEGCLMSGCNVGSILFELQRLNAILAGERITTTVDGVETTLADYRETGIRPTLREIGIAPVSWQDDLGSILTGEVSLASIAKTGLVGRRIDLTPLPGEGSGLADITDEMLDKLQDRFVMQDSSIFNPFFGQKNIVEAMETLFRLDSVTDIELRPNIASLLSTGDSSILITGLKVLVKKWRDKLNLPPGLAQWFDDKLSTQKHMSAGDLLLLIAHALQELEGQTGDLDLTTTINLVNTNNCNGSSSAPAADKPDVKISLTDEGVSVEQPLLEGG